MEIFNIFNSLDLKLKDFTVIILNTEVSGDEITNSIKCSYYGYRMALGMPDYRTMIWFKKGHYNHLNKLY
jgi:hypothetical protein